MLDGHCWAAPSLLCCSPAILSCPLQGRVRWRSHFVRLTFLRVPQVHGFVGVQDIVAMVSFIFYISDEQFIIWDPVSGMDPSRLR